MPKKKEPISVGEDMAADDARGDTGRSLDLDLADVDSWPQMLTPQEVATVMRVNYRTVLKQIADGRIAAHRIGVGYRVNKTWLINEIGQGRQRCND